MSAVNVDRNGTAGLLALNDRLIKEHIRYRGPILVHITDAKAEQLTDTSASRNADHEQTAIADFKSAGETC